MLSNDIDRTEMKQAVAATSQPDQDNDVTRLTALLGNASGLRLVLLHLLALCRTPRDAAFLDAETVRFMQGQVSVYAPVTLRQWLEKAGGLEKAGEIDKAEEQARASEGDNQTPSDIWQTTSAGLLVAAQMDLSQELSGLLDRSPDHRQTYLSILSFCQTPRSKKEIDSRLEGDPSINPPTSYPLTFLAALEEVGAIRWDGQWKTTELGQQACA